MDCPDAERAPLLKPAPSTAPSAPPTSREWAHELWHLLRSSAPVALAYTLQNALQTGSVLVVGRRSPHDLAVASFAYMFAMATAWLVALGGSTALDTLGGTAYAAAEAETTQVEVDGQAEDQARPSDPRPPRTPDAARPVRPVGLGILLQRALLVLTAFYTPIALLWSLSAPVFLLLGQDPLLAHDAARFLTVLVPGGLGYIYFECMKKYLQAQGLMRPGTYALAVVVPLNLLLNYTLVYPADLGLLGAPLATGISYWLAFLLLVGYVRFVAGGDSWGGFAPREACAWRDGLWPFTRLAFLGFIQVGTEWWAFEIVALAAGKLGSLPLEAQSVIMTTDQVLTTIPFGVGVAASARVANCLGARKAPEASRAAHTAAALSILLGVLVGVVLLATRNVFARLFTTDESVIGLVGHVMPPVALFQLADGLNGSCGGALRGMGRQHVGAAVNLLSYYAGALPLGLYLAFRRGWGLMGLWVGQCIALYLVGGVEWALVAATKWERQVEKAHGRLS